jgi:hypothetical protein
MGKIEGGEERFEKRLYDSPILLVEKRKDSI